MTDPIECRTCPDRKVFEEYGKQYSYCGHMGLNVFDGQPIMKVDYWMHVGSSFYGCPRRMKEYFE
jgi:hypothetical protein